MEGLETDRGVCVSERAFSEMFPLPGGEEGVDPPPPPPEEAAYRSHLTRMDALVDSIMAGLDDVSAVVARAKVAQEHLYGAFSKVCGALLCVPALPCPILPSSYSFLTCGAG